jgi:hypothetical protein
MAEPKDNWANPSTYVCHTCMYFVPKMPPAPDPNLAPLGRCRRRAPTMDGDLDWPAVYANDWCGDHKLGLGHD